ncbi:MAG TPA: MBL fold metallo-hydrolase, partial [Catenuloplanes sp.]
SGWLRETAGAWVAMHPAERDTLPARIWSGAAAVGTDRAWLREQGVPEDDLAALLVELDPGSPLLAMAEPDRLLGDGDLLPIHGRRVRAVWTPGHTPGHLCLHDAEAGVLLTGDHLLPRISPTIGVHGGHDDDPLTGYLESLRRMTRYAASEALPAHEYRFREVDARAAYLIGHHRDRCTEIVTMLTAAGPATCWQVAVELSWSRGWTTLSGMMRRMALAETLAHLRHLRTTGTVVCDTGSPRRWRRRDPAAPTRPPG